MGFKLFESLAIIAFHIMGHCKKNENLHQANLWI
jgi:hypothetical protein